MAVKLQKALELWSWCLRIGGAGQAVARKELNYWLRLEIRCRSFNLSRGGIFVSSETATLIATRTIFFLFTFGFVCIKSLS